jgi:hypothetical protein
MVTVFSLLEKVCAISAPTAVVPCTWW